MADEVDTAADEVDTAAVEGGGEQEKEQEQKQVAVEGGGPVKDPNAAAGSGNVVYDTLNKVVKGYEEKLELSKLHPDDYKGENAVSDDLITAGVLQFCSENNRAASTAKPAVEATSTGQGGGRRRSKRRYGKKGGKKSRKSAKQSKKGGRRSSKNRRKHSHRSRKH